MIDNTVFTGVLNDELTVSMQQWAGEALQGMTFVKDYNGLLPLHNRIILLQIREANFRFDLLKTLLENNNYFVFVDPYENNIRAHSDLVHDLPELDRFPLLTAGEQDPGQHHVNVEGYFFLTLSDTNILRAKYYTIDKYFEQKQKPFKFQYLNGRHCDHRWRLWQQLDQRGLIESSLRSYLGYPTPGMEEDTNPLGEPVTIPPEYETNYYDRNNVPRFSNDIRNSVSFRFLHWGGQGFQGNHIVPKQFTDTYFSVVTETMTHRLFCTEKTWKPILAGHPFIFLSAPGHYKKLHEMGFQTFDRWIDESFDEEPDLDRRIEMIADQIEHLCNQDLEQFLQEVEPVCRHNQNHILSYRYTHIKTIHDRLHTFCDQVRVDAENYFHDNTVEKTLTY